ncbi:MAG: aldehyde ferredoxin oxidoreductase family protein [Desulfuromusa sp.]|nr:aldehyde ferredoxin oxidoreductase family protein [Desulfuromusa sp.]
MKELIGPSNKILEVDLSKQTFCVTTVSARDRALYLGGKGLGLKLLYDRLQPGIDPLGEENIIVIMPGVLMGTGAPCSGRFDAVTKSPLTGIIVSSSCGGPFGMQLKTAGWDGLVLSGRAKEPVVLEVVADGAIFKKASHLWGMDTLRTQQAIATVKNSGALAIGPAGENLVRYANVASAQRFLGRGGVGAVFGSKNLKGIVAIGGDYKIKPVDQQKFTKVKKRAAAYIKQFEMTSVTYPQFGTSANVNITNAAGILPVRNFKDGSHERAVEVSGERMKEKHETKYHTCKPCSILCGHKGDFGGKQLPVPEYETVGLLGTNLEIFDSELIAEWNQICGEMGMDTISAGGTIAWVMEAAEKGLLISDLKFGSAEGVSEILNAIAHCQGIGAEMALGSRAMADKYGGKDFAIQVKGMELPAYDPRGSFGHGLAYAVANRGGCHLSAFVTSLEVFFGLLKPYTEKAKPEFTKFFESLNAGVNSLQACLFTSYAYLMEAPLTKYTPHFLLAALMQYLPRIAIFLTDFSIYSDLWSSITGIRMTQRDFLKAGDRIHVLERYMNTREGITHKDDSLPGRMLNEGRICDPKKRTVPLENMLRRYYKIRGYDRNGLPTARTLRNLGIN